MSGLGSRSNTATTTSAALLLVVLFVHATAMAAERSRAAAQPLDLGILIQRIADAQLENHSRSVPYSVTREYKVFTAEADRLRSQVVAKVNFLPPNVKSYDIDQTTGGMGDKVVRRILDHEVDATR